MMNIFLHTYYFIGIGGIGMSSIAHYLLSNGCKVYGYDRVKTEITKGLERKGAILCFDDKLDALPFNKSTLDLIVIYTPAIPVIHPQLDYFKNHKGKLYKRAEFLALLVNLTHCLAVAGTHGKTTTSAILTYMLTQCKAPFTSFIGGIMKEIESNMVSLGTKYTVVEADEYDRSFLRLFPTSAIITSMDADHLDIYENKENIEEAFIEFSHQVKHKLVHKKGLPFQGISYSVEEMADYYAEKIQPYQKGYKFDLVTPKKTFRGLYFNQLGLHNLSNAVAAFALSFENGFAEEGLISGLQSFPGVKRRLDVVLNTDSKFIIDDYAHHPEEIKQVYETLQNLHPDKEKCVIFQPHLFSRTQDFLNEFAKILSLFDRVILLPIYPARELPITGVTSELLLHKITTTNKYVFSKETLKNEINTLPEPIIAFLGAGDIGEEVQLIKKTML